MTDIIRKYHIELVLLLILIFCIIIFVFVKNSNSEEKESISREELFEYENSDSDIFYSKMNRMQESEYKEKQIVSIGETVRVASFRTYKTEETNFYVKLDSAYIADRFCGGKNEGRKYLVLYMTVENKCANDGILMFFPQMLEYYNKQTSQRENADILYGNMTPYVDYGTLYLKDEDRGVVWSDKIIFEKNNYSFQYVFVPAKDYSRVKIIYPLDLNDTRLFNSDYELWLNNNVSGKDWYNSGYMIKIPFDKLCQIDNVNDGWDDENINSSGELYDKVIRLTTANFYDMQIKHLGESISCYMNNGKVNITLNTASLLEKQKELKLILTVENEGNDEIKWIEMADFNIVGFDQFESYYSPFYVSLVDNWNEAVDGSDRIIEGGGNAKIELIVPVNYDKAPDNYILGFQLITNGHMNEFTNEDFAFILDWDKVEIIND